MFKGSFCKMKQLRVCFKTPFINKIDYTTLPKARVTRLKRMFETDVRIRNQYGNVVFQLCRRKRSSNYPHPIQTNVCNWSNTRLQIALIKWLIWAN